MENKNIFITGISTGIGKDAAIYLASKGFNIYGTVRKSSDASYISDQGLTSIHAVILEVTDNERIKEVANEMKDIPLSGLINNAGIAVSGPLKYIDLSDFKRQFDVNVFAMLAVTQAFIPNLELNKKFNGEAGRLINISSVSGIVATPFRVAYSASKFAVEALSDGLRRELYKLGIKVCIIQPGPIKTPIWDKALEADPGSFINEYKDVLDFRNEYVRQTASAALPVEEVSKAIYHALTSSNPKIRYLIVKHPWLSKLKFNLPARLLDHLIMKAVKLK